MAQVQWFPGHMAKARREMSERMKWVDMIIELVDARAPYSSKNPMIDEIAKNKPRLVVLTKNDMADEKRTRVWIEYYESLGYKAISVNLKRFREYQKIISECRNILKDKMEKERQRGMQPRAIRAIVVGIPNVGKSTFINSLAGKKAAITGNKPGVTKSQQLIRVDKDFELFDTPGVLWPKFEDERIARNIAFLGSIKQTILPLDELFIEAMKYMNVHYPDLLKARYNLSFDLDDDWVLPVFDHIARVRAIKKLRGETDYDRVIEVLFNDIFDGSIGRITWEDVSCVND